MITKQSDQDRRGYQRVSWDYHARLMQLRSESGETIPGMHASIGLDISEGGMQVWSNRFFAVRSRLLVEMEAPEVPEGIQAVGSVVWASAMTTPDQWRLGIEFSDLGDSARQRIRSVLPEARLSH